MAQLFKIMPNGEALPVGGPPGRDGDVGPPGNNGWSPVVSAEEGGERRVLRILDWTGGTEDKPQTGYIGASGTVSTAAQALDIRGAVGGTGPAGKDGQGVPSNGETGQALVKNSSDPYDTQWRDFVIRTPEAAADGTTYNLSFALPELAQLQKIVFDIVVPATQDEEYSNLLVFLLDPEATEYDAGFFTNTGTPNTELWLVEQFSIFFPTHIVLSIEPMLEYGRCRVQFVATTSPYATPWYTPETTVGEGFYFQNIQGNPATLSEVPVLQFVTVDRPIPEGTRISMRGVAKEGGIASV